MKRAITSHELEISDEAHAQMTFGSLHLIDAHHVNADRVVTMTASERRRLHIRRHAKIEKSR